MKKLIEFFNLDGFLRETMPFSTLWAAWNEKVVGNHSTTKYHPHNTTNEAIVAKLCEHDDSYRARTRKNNWEARVPESADDLAEKMRDMRAARSTTTNGKEDNWNRQWFSIQLQKQAHESMKENEGPFLHEEEYCDSVGRTGQVRLYDGAPEAEVYILDIYGQAVEAVNQLNETLENGGSVTREDAATVFGRIWSLALLSLGHADIDSDGLEVHHILSISSFGHPTSLKNKQLMIKLVHVLSHAASMIGHLGNIALENSFRVTLCFRWRSIEPFWDDSDEVIARSSEYSIARFHARMGELEAFKVEHDGDVFVPSGSSLYTWLQNTKKKYQEDGLTGEQIARLKDVGILDGDEWLYPSTNRSFESWMAELKAFKEEHGHVRVPRGSVASEGGAADPRSSLYIWLQNTKKMYREDKLTGVQIAFFRDIGILVGDEWLHPRDIFTESRISDTPQHRWATTGSFTTNYPQDGSWPQRDPSEANWNIAYAPHHSTRQYPNPLHPTAMLPPPPSPPPPYYPTYYDYLPAGTPPQQYHYHQPPAVSDLEVEALRNAYTLAQQQE